MNPLPPQKKKHTYTHLELPKADGGDRHFQIHSLHRGIQGDQMLLLQPELIHVNNGMVITRRPFFETPTRQAENRKSETDIKKNPLGFPVKNKEKKMCTC